MRRRRKNPGGSVLVLGVGALALGGLAFYLYKRGVFSPAPRSVIALHAAGAPFTPDGMTNQQGKKVTDTFAIKDDYAPGGPGATPFDPTSGVEVQSWAAKTAALSAAPMLSWRQALAASADRGIRVPRSLPTGGGIGDAPPPL